MSLVPESEAEETARRGASVIESRGPPRKVVGRETVDPPVRTEGQLGGIAHARVIDWREARQERSGRVDLEDETSPLRHSFHRAEVAGRDEDLIGIGRKRQRLQVRSPSGSVKTLQDRWRSCARDNPEPTARVVCHRQAWRSDSPVCVAAGSSKELSMPEALKVEPQRLIERQGQLIGRVVALSFEIVALAEVEFLDRGAELLPGTFAPGRHPEEKGVCAHRPLLRSAFARRL